MFMFTLCLAPGHQYLLERKLYTAQVSGFFNKCHRRAPLDDLTLVVSRTWLVVLQDCIYGHASSDCTLYYLLILYFLQVEGLWPPCTKEV